MPDPDARLKLAQIQMIPLSEPFRICSESSNCQNSWLIPEVVNLLEWKLEFTIQQLMEWDPRDSFMNEIKDLVRASIALLDRQKKELLSATR
jgi:hypothetical protein